MPEEKKDPEEQNAPTDNPQEPVAPSTPDDGQAKEPQEDLPDKFKGKSAAEIAKSYLELEKKLGENSSSSQKYKEALDQWEQLGQVILEDPELAQKVKEKAQKKFAPEQPNNKSEPPKRDDVKIAMQNTIYSDFEKDYGINKLDLEKRKELGGKVATELAYMLDPEGKKSYQEILNSISLDRLPAYLSKAYTLATNSDDEEKARLKGYLEARENSEAMFGSVPSTGANGKQDSLTPEERKAAQKLGVSEKDYLESKKKLNEN